MTSLESSPWAAAIDVARAAQDGAVPAAEAGATGGGDWAICCSGDGIRSADNLGLVEALRRGARHIVVLDASGDRADMWFTPGGSIALARSDAGVSITLDPTKMIEGGARLKPGQVVHPWAYGTFSRVPGRPGLPERGEIWVCKLGWWTEAPWEVLAYAQDHSTYLCDSTLEQLYDAAEFEAYHELGGAAVRAAAKECTPPLTCPVPVGHGSPPVPTQVGNAPGT